MLMMKKETKKSKKQKNTNQEKCIVGGQAVIEGVMMKSPNYVCVAVRKKNNKISVKEIEYTHLAKKCKFFGWPFFRGIITLYEMLSLGIKSLTFSANESGEDEEKLSYSAMIFAIIISLLFAIGLFVVVPYMLALVFGFHEEKSSVMFNLVDGLIKLIIFMLYLITIGLMKDIRRVFQYHGAEHKAVNCYEAGLKLTVNNCKKFTSLNPRCGTSFLLVVIIFGIILFSFVPFITSLVFPDVFNLSVFYRKLIFLGVRLLFLLPLVSVSYEFLKLSARFSSNWLMKLLIQPGLIVQKLTTRNPSNKQVGVALEALKFVLKKEGVQV